MGYKKKRQKIAQKKAQNVFLKRVFTDIYQNNVLPYCTASELISVTPGYYDNVCVFCFVLSVLFCFPSIAPLLFKPVISCFSVQYCLC